MLLILFFKVVRNFTSLSRVWVRSGQLGMGFVFHPNLRKASPDTDTELSSSASWASVFFTEVADQLELGRIYHDRLWPRDRPPHCETTGCCPSSQPIFHQFCEVFRTYLLRSAICHSRSVIPTVLRSRARRKTISMQINSNVSGHVIHLSLSKGLQVEQTHSSAITKLLFKVYALWWRFSHRADQSPLRGHNASTDQYSL